MSFKEYRKVEEQGNEIAELKSTVAELKSALKEQAANSAKRLGRAARILPPTKDQTNRAPSESGRGVDVGCDRGGGSVRAGYKQRWHKASQKRLGCNQPE